MFPLDTGRAQTQWGRSYTGVRRKDLKSIGIAANYSIVVARALGPIRGEKLSPPTAALSRIFHQFGIAVGCYAIAQSSAVNQQALPAAAWQAFFDSGRVPIMTRCILL